MSLTVSVNRFPFPYEPVNTNGMWFSLSSTYSTYTDFKYIYSLYSYNATGWGTASGTSSETYYLGSFKVPPDVYTGNGNYTPHRALKSKMSNRLLYGVILASSTQSTLFHYNNSPLKYKIDYGFELNPLYDVAKIKQVSPYTNIQLDFVGQKEISVGDILKINKTNPQYDSFINTYVNVLSTTFSSPTYSIMLDISTSLGGLQMTNDTGTIVYQKRMISSITQSNLGTQVGGGNGTYTDLYAIDGIRDAENDYTIKVIGTMKDSFVLTSLKDRNIYLNQYDSVSVLSDNTMVTGMDKIDAIYVKLVNSAGSIYQTFSYSTYYSTYTAAYPSARCWTIPCGTSEIGTITGASLSLASGYYVIPYCNTTGQTFSIYRNIVDNCSPYELVRLAWLNKYGGYDFFNFNMMSKMSSSINRTEYKKTLPYDYNVSNYLGNRQNVYLNTVSQENYTINTDWVSESEYSLLQELVESPEVYIVNGLTYSGAGNIFLVSVQPLPNPQITPIMITNTTYDRKKTINDYMFNMTITYKKAYDKINHTR